MTIAEAARAVGVWKVGSASHKPAVGQRVRMLTPWPKREELFEVEATWKAAPKEANEFEGYFAYSLWSDNFEAGLEGVLWREL
jgi:hypothetical protein